MIRLERCWPTGDVGILRATSEPSASQIRSRRRDFAPAKSCRKRPQLVTAGRGAKALCAYRQVAAICSDHRRRVTSDEFRANARGAVARTCELAIAARVSTHAPLVIDAVNLDYEPDARRIEVSNEAEQRDLPPKCDAELARAQSAPQPSL